jgi:WD40 repeat protein
MMNKTNITFFLTFICNFICHPIFCMEEPSSAVTSTEPFVENAESVAWIDNNTIFVGGENKYVIINPFTKNVIAERENEYSDSSSVTVNKTLTQYAILTRHQVQCFNAKNHQLLWTEPSKYAFNIVFNSQNENKVIYAEMNSSKEPSLLKSITDHLQYTISQDRDRISCHPNESTLLYCCNTYEGRKDKHVLRIVTKRGISTYDITGKSNIEDSHFSLDGNQIVACWDNELKIYSYPTINLISTIALESDYSNAVFYNDDILITLTLDDTISYYHYRTGKLLHQIDLSEPTTFYVPGKNKLSVSPDKKNLLVATKTGYLIVPITVDVQ